MPFRDTDLEALYYYGKFLLTRLPRADSGDAVDLDGVVVLTHLRTELIAEQQNASLSEGGDEPLVGPGEGRGKQHDQPTDTLSSLIEAFNERFGLNLTDVDRILFEQQATHLQADEEVRVVALHNDLEQFKVFIEGEAEDSVVDRQEQNEAIFQAYFDRPGFREMLNNWLATSVCRAVRHAGRRHDAPCEAPQGTPPDRPVTR